MTRWLPKRPLMHPITGHWKVSAKSTRASSRLAHGDHARLFALDALGDLRWRLDGFRRHADDAFDRKIARRDLDDDVFALAARFDDVDRDRAFLVAADAERDLAMRADAHIASGEAHLGFRIDMGANQ